MALPAEKSLSCVIDEVYGSPLCSLIYYFFKMTGCWGLGRVVWVLRLMSERVTVSMFCLGSCLFGCCSSAAIAQGCPPSGGVCTALAAFGSPGTVLGTG